MLGRFIEILAYFTSSWTSLFGSEFDPARLDATVPLADIDLHPRNCSPGCTR